MVSLHFSPHLARLLLALDIPASSAMMEGRPRRERRAPVRRFSMAVIHYRGLEMERYAQDVPGGAAVRRLAQLARETGLWLHCGSLYERAPQGGRPYNCTLVIRPDGTLAGKYRKLHPFDVAVPNGPAVRESDQIRPGEEKKLCQLIREKTGSEFVFVTHYPSAKRPFYAMDDPQNPEETLSFDLLFRGMEVTTGGQRIHSYETQVEKMRQKRLNPEDFSSYLMIHHCGMPPHGGLGLGLERLTSRLLEQDNVRRACLFPRDIHRLTP